MEHFIATYGYWFVGTVIALESMAVPLPGETTLVSAAIYAGTTHHLKITYLIAAAAAGAVIGDNLGFWIGRRYGYALLLRYGHLVRLSTRRIKVGQYLFFRFGGSVVFFGRFIAILRALAALLAGVNRMNWWRFFLFNVAGGIAWTTLYGLAAYVFGRHVERLQSDVAIVGFILAFFGAAAVWWVIRRHESALEAHAEQAMPGPLA